MNLQVFVHNPYSSQSSGGRISIEDSDISLLTVNQSVTSLKAGKLYPAIDRDVLCIGTHTNLLAYDVHNNTDLFYKQVTMLESITIKFNLNCLIQVLF